MTNGYRDLIVWQKSMDLVILIYDFTVELEKFERFGLCSQMRRSAVSIPSNIAEGRYRSSRKDYKNFLTIAFASGAELETQLEICSRLKVGEEIKRTKSVVVLNEVMKMLNVMVEKMGPLE